MPHVIAEPCIGAMHKACVDACPTDCIHEGTRMLYINPEECIDCGACAEACPSKAIFPQDDLPEKWKFYAEINRRFYPARDEAAAWEGRSLPAVGDRKG